jgi:hypothetical protein
MFNSMIAILFTGVLVMFMSLIVGAIVGAPLMKMFDPTEEQLEALAEKKKKLEAINQKRKAAGQNLLVLAEADARIEKKSLPENSPGLAGGFLAGFVSFFALLFVFAPWSYGLMTGTAPLTFNVLLGIDRRTTIAASAANPASSPSEQANSIVKAALEGTSAEVSPEGIAKVTWKPDEEAALVFSQLNFMLPRFVPKLFEKIPSVKSVIVTGIGTKKDDYGKITSGEVCSITFSRETAAKVHWADVNLARLGRIADAFKYDPAMLPK